VAGAGLRSCLMAYLCISGVEHSDSTSCESWFLHWGLDGSPTPVPIRLTFLRNKQEPPNLNIQE
jgi:hypothetical protein